MTKAVSTNGPKTNSVLRSYADHAVTFVGAHFEPQITFAKKLPNVAEAVLKRCNAPHWTSSGDRYTIRETNKKYLYHIDHHVFLTDVGAGPLAGGT